MSCQLAKVPHVLDPILKTLKGRQQTLDAIMNRLTGYAELHSKVKDLQLTFLQSTRHIQALIRDYERLDSFVTLGMKREQAILMILNSIDCSVAILSEEAEEGGIAAPGGKIGCLVMKSECRNLLYKCMDEVSARPSPEQLQTLLSQMQVIQPELTKQWLQTAMAQRRSYLKRSQAKKQKLQRPVPALRADGDQVLVQQEPAIFVFEGRED